MTTLKDIRKRLHTTQNIKQITKAMEMIAAARLYRIQAKVVQAKPFSSKLQELLDHLSTTAISHPLFEKREGKRIGLVVVTGDRGLCGSYNYNVLEAADQFLKEHANKKIELILIGHKAVEHYKSRINSDKHVKYTWVKWGDQLDFSHTKQFANQLVDWFLSRDLDQIWVAYTQYINILSRQVKIEKFLNIENSSAKSKPTVSNYLFEPDRESIYQALIPYYYETKIQSILMEAYASELSARVVSMKAATKNADEMIYKLTLTRNKIRQTNITREMLEITAGAESLKY